MVVLKSPICAIAQWIRLRLPSCHPGFKSQAHHLRYHQFIELFNVEKTKIKKEAVIGPFYKESNLCKGNTSEMRNGNPSNESRQKGKLNICERPQTGKRRQRSMPLDNFVNVDETKLTGGRGKVAEKAAEEIKLENIFILT